MSKYFFSYNFSCQWTLSPLRKTTFSSSVFQSRNRVLPVFWKIIAHLRAECVLRRRPLPPDPVQCRGCGAHARREVCFCLGSVTSCGPTFAGAFCDDDACTLLSPSSSTCFSPRGGAKEVYSGLQREVIQWFINDNTRLNGFASSAL